MRILSNLFFVAAVSMLLPSTPAKAEQAEPDSNFFTKKFMDHYPYGRDISRENKAVCDGLEKNIVQLPPSEADKKNGEQRFVICQTQKETSFFTDGLCGFGRLGVLSMSNLKESLSTAANTLEGFTADDAAAQGFDKDSMLMDWNRVKKIIEGDMIVYNNLIQRHCHDRQFVY